MAHEKHKELIQVLHECMEACNHCYDACLKEEDSHMNKCIRLDRECADFCAYFEQALARDTPFVAELAAACAKICEACGEECNRHSHEHCQRCAKACFECAEACKKVA